MPHLHPLTVSAWSLWRWVCVRGPGFPAELVLALASRDTSALVDRILALEQESLSAVSQAIAHVTSDLEAQTGRENRPRRRSITAQLMKLRAGNVPGSTEMLGPEAAAATALVRSTAEDLAELRAEAVRTLAAEHQRCGEVLREIGRDPRFREAMQWQNPHALATGVDVLLRQPVTSTNAKTRGQERLVASQLQRYCVKNESIGFFGPVGWGAIVDDAPAMAVQPGPALLAARTLYFEHWGIDALAQVIAANPQLRRHLAPRRHPAIWLDGTVLHFPIDRTSELPFEFACVLGACDGRQSALELARNIDPEVALGEADVYDVLDELVAKKLVIWTLEIPPHVEHPDRTLADALDAIAEIDPEVVAPARAMLGELQAARDAIAKAAGDPVALAEAMAHLDDVFTRHTGMPPTRRSGETYAGRTLVYEDCRRDVDVRFGPQIFERISVPLSLLLASARWFTFELARRYRETFVAIHRELVQETGEPAIDFMRFWDRASAHFSSDSRKAPPLVAEVVHELQHRWATVFGLDDASRSLRRLEVKPARLAAAGEQFAAPRPGWPSARYHSPDLMIAAADIDAIARGELVVVAGELHVSAATVAVPWTLRQHPDPAAIVAALERERPWESIEAVVSKERATRADGFSLHSRDLDLELGASRSWRPRERVLEAGALVVEPHEDSLRLRTRDGSRTFALEQLLDSFLARASASHFKLIAHAPHVPRITIDNLVVSREAWRFEITTLDFLAIDDPLDRVVAVRRWARAHELPRFVFYTIPEETKPCYLDLDSPHFIELFVHIARKASALAISEMLPAIDQSWLIDRENRRYTSELRLVAVDPVPWR